MTKTPRLGALLRSQRLSRNWTQRELAQRAACEVSMVSHAERDTRVPDEALAAALDQALDTGGSLIEAARAARSLPRSPRTVGAQPSQLPPAPQYLLGRDRHMRQLDRLVSSAVSTPIVSVEGGAGVGKSGLVLAWAHSQAHRHPDGQLVVRLGGHRGPEPASPHAVLAGLLSDLGVRSIPQETGARSRLLRSVLHQRRMLLLLDDADSTDQVLPLLPGTASCTVVITSRRRLTGLTIAGSASRMPLEPLEEADTVALLRRMLPDEVDEETALARIASGTAGLPLAVRAAIEIINDHPGWSLHELAGPLAGPRRLQVLTTAALTHPAASLRAAFAASYRRLSQPAAALFRALGHHGAAVSTDEAMRLLEASVDEAQAALAQLIGESLLMPTMTGGHGNGLIHAYAAELAADQDCPPKGTALSCA